MSAAKVQKADGNNCRMIIRRSLSIDFVLISSIIAIVGVDEMMRCTT